MLLLMKQILWDRPFEGRIIGAKAAAVQTFTAKKQDLMRQTRENASSAGVIKKQILYIIRRRLHFA